MAPKQSSNVEVAAPFIAAETLKGTCYGSFKPDEYQIVGEVVAIAKIIEE